MMDFNVPPSVNYQEVSCHPRLYNWLTKGHLAVIGWSTVPFFEESVLQRQKIGHNGQFLMAWGKKDMDDPSNG